MALNKKIKIAAALLLALVLVIWGVFYLHSANSIRVSNENHLQQISTQIIDRLESELLDLEYVSYTLSQNEAVQEFAAEQNALAFHEKSAGVDEIMDTLGDASGPNAHIVVYNRDGVWANFAGSLGHAAAGALYKNLDTSALPRYRAITLEGVRYISYARSVETAGAKQGCVVLLAEEERLLGMLSEYLTTDGLVVSLSEGNRIVASSDAELLNQSVEQASVSSLLLKRRKLGFAPVEVLVSTGAGTLVQVSRDYGLAALLTALLLAALLILFARLANRHLFRPMLHVIRDVESLGSVGQQAIALNPTGEPSFDGLVDQINQMLGRLDEKNRALLSAQSRLQSAEIERQQALIISLKKQIDAHFTVNVLNDVKVLAEGGETEKAAEVADGLSHLLRYANAEDEFVDGMEELFVLEKYVAIMGIRYGSDFTAEFDWDDRLGRVKMPRMLLQPLVENAMAHGLAPKQAGGTLRVSGRLDDGMIRITVEDNGVGMSEKELERVRRSIAAADASSWAAGGIEQVALANIHRRLQSYYQQNFVFTIESRTVWGTTVSLSFPDHTVRQ